MPPGEPYGGQGQQHHHQQQQQQQHQFQQFQQQTQQFPLQQQLPPLQAGPHAPPHHQPYPQYPNPYANGNQQYQLQHGQFVHPTYSNQHAQFYPSSAPQQQQFAGYNDPYHQSAQPLQRVSMPALAPAPPQFVDPSYLQPAPFPRSPARIPPNIVFPTSQPPLAPAMSPQFPVATQPLPPRPMPVKASPKLEERRPPSQGTPKLLTKHPRRMSSSAGITKSPATPHASSHLETLPLLLHVAEDCFEKANAAARTIVKSMAADEVAEHHKLVATGLGCLNVALQSNKLYPRLEARLCLRYAGVLIEETTNISEAETILTRGISVCDKHRFLDLKYSSQFMLMKTLFQRNQKAAFKSIENHISDCTTYKHVPWIYAFRFLKTAFHVQSGSAADHHAIENLRKIAGIAHQRSDKAIFVMAMLLEGLAHLSTMKDDWATRVQMCIAQASKLQLDETIRTPQTDILLLLLDVSCSMHQKNHQISTQKLHALQTRLEELKQSKDWASDSGELLLPINRMQNAQQIVSTDTRAVLRPGDNSLDHLVLSALGKQEAWALAFMFNGIVACYKSSTPGRSSGMWAEAIRLLDDRNKNTSAESLSAALKHSEWAKELICYAQILIGLQASTLSDWAKVKACLQTVEENQPETGFRRVLTLYLRGVFYQGTAALDKALEIWKDKTFEMDWTGAPKSTGSRIEMELSILAALNRLWIMQDPTQTDDAETAELVDCLRPICEDNPDQEIRTVYNLVMSSIHVNPPLSINQVKRHIQQSLSGAQQTSNTQYLSIALNVMRCRLFENVVGEQALKSAKAGAAQAKKSGNVLWMSVADGMLAQSFEMQGVLAEARATHDAGVRLANEAFAKTQV